MRPRDRRRVMYTSKLSTVYVNSPLDYVSETSALGEVHLRNQAVGY